jgi:hypothetical protein
VFRGRYYNVTVTAVNTDNLEDKKLREITSAVRLTKKFQFRIFVCFSIDELTDNH